ncbi:unnamed protein product [Mytilus coruscus]|uniref:TRIM2_3 n=1 Tax=Mytilus coruscus TaxID=42192 RepID=A0A6J7ZWT2_MYTCO|nr:unnamed protein product [Mytilus coruscus]
MNEVDQLGKLSVRNITTSLPFNKIDQAQIQLRVQDTKSINYVGLQLKTRFNVKQEGVLRVLTGCTMLPNGNLLIADYYGKNVLIEYNEDGKHIRDIPCSDSPFDLTVMDTERIAVTYANDVADDIEFLIIKNNTIEKKVNLNSICNGILCQDNKLFIVIEDGIVITDIAGKVLKQLIVDCDSCIGTTKDRINFTVKDDQTVHCISMTGEEILVRKEESLVHPSGITVDDHQNVFVVDRDSNSLIVIQHDGRSSITLLSETDGLVNPRSLHYNKDKKVFLLCDGNGCALYNLG